MFMSKLNTRNENKVNFKKKTYAELQELLERQNKILRNKPFVDGLPDKGEKVKDFLTQLELELDKRAVHEKLCADMSSLNIDKNQLDTLEWTGNHLSSMTSKASQPATDDGDGDALKMFVSHSGVQQDKIIIKEKPEELLIKPSDLIEEEPIVGSIQVGDEFNEFPENVERYAKDLCGRYDTYSPAEKRHLLLNKPVKPNKHSTVKASAVSLKESVMLQFLHENRLKELKEDILKKRPIPKYNFVTYRDSKIDEESNSSEDETLEDDIDDDSGMTVVVNSSYKY